MEGWSPVPPARGRGEVSGGAGLQRGRFGIRAGDRREGKKRLNGENDHVGTLQFCS